MKFNFFKYIFCLVLALTLYSCNETTGKKYLPQSNGAINSLTVVVDKDLWKGAVGDTIRAHFASPIDYLPGDSEPTFTLHHLPPDVFTGNTRNSRNILIISVGQGHSKVEMDTLYAIPQKVITLEGNSTDDIIKQIQANSCDIIDSFKKNENSEVITRFGNNIKKEEEIKKVLGLNVSLPDFYQRVKKENDFFWIEKRINGGTANLLFYQVNKKSISPNHMPQSIVRVMDSIGKRYVPGREEGMYKRVEAKFTPEIRMVSVENKNALEVKGLWEMKDFLLGGPFVSYWYDLGDKYVVAEGFILAPGFKKRDQLFELESIIKNIK